MILTLIPLKPKSMINKERRCEIKQTVLQTLSLLRDVSLPIPIEDIVRFHNNCHLVPYSALMNKLHLSYTELLSNIDSKDGFSLCTRKTGAYWIFYNDVDRLIISSKRYRWSIAHELGHVLLNHHKNGNKVQLSRKSLSASQYVIFEEEADLFASYILCPYAILCCYPIKGDGNIAAICNISQQAASNRYRDYKLWRKNWNQGTADIYDFKIRWLYTHKKRCKNCGADIKDFDYNFCPICGKRSFLYIKEDSKMVYDGVPVDENGRVKVCPRCENEEIIPDSSYCHICGLESKNTCLGEYNVFGEQYAGACEESKKHALPSNARFCPYCGAPTSFSSALPKWKDEFNSSKSELPF